MSVPFNSPFIFKLVILYFCSALMAEDNLPALSTVMVVVCAKEIVVDKTTTAVNKNFLIYSIFLIRLFYYNFRRFYFFSI